MLSPARVWLALDSCFAVPICSAFLPNGLTFSSHNSWMLLGSLPFLIFLVQSVSCAVLFASWYSSRPHCCALAMRVIVIPALRLRMFYSDMRSSFRKYRLNTELTQKSNEDSIFHFPFFIFHFSPYSFLYYYFSNRETAKCALAKARIEVRGERRAEGFECDMCSGSTPRCLCSRQEPTPE
jgi:hypothetical protein